jgi:cell division protein FtsW
MSPPGSRTGLRDRGADGAESEPTSQAAQSSGAASLRSTARVLLEHPLAPYYILLGAASLLLVTGLVMVLSASGLYAERIFGNPYSFFLRQLLFACVALPVALVVSRQPPRRFRRLAWVAVVLSVLLMLMTFVPGFGGEANGSRNWLDFGGPFSLQPSEFAKFSLILWGAHVYARKGDRVAEWRHLLLPFLVVAALIMAMTVAQRDLGTAAIIAAIVMAMLWVLGVPGRLFALLGAGAALLGAIFVIREPYRKDRLTSFLDPFADPLDTGYQVVNSIYAFASGGWWGSGLGGSRQKWGRLPEAHTDFIYAVVGEELGLIGSLVVLVLVLALAYAGIRIAMEAVDLHQTLLAAGITAWLLTQFTVNVGGALGVLPLTGVPLPLVSYGGSALIITVAAVAVLLAIARAEPAAAEAIQARAVRRSMRRGWRRRTWRKG